MRTRMHVVIVTLGALVGAASQSGCAYYGTRAHGATYFGYPDYYYAEAFRPQPRNIYVPPATAVGGGPAASAQPPPSHR